MKTSLELQAERDAEARRRLAEVPNLGWSMYVDSKPTRVDPVMDCCEAPLKPFPTSAFYNRHRRGFAGRPKSDACRPALLCAALDRNGRRGSKLRPPEHPDGAPCCGAPSVPEPTYKYRHRHEKGLRGYPISPLCQRAIDCVNLCAREYLATARRNNAKTSSAR